MKKELAGHGARIDAIYYCPHHPDDDCACRKPKPGLILQAAREHGIETGLSFMVGDAIKDVAAGKAAGCRTVWLNDGATTSGELAKTAPDYVTPTLLEAARWIIKQEGA
jgi:D-glycero-D-manno-heptose 1,7-bisphosphate phosphatase